MELADIGIFCIGRNSCLLYLHRKLLHQQKHLDSSSHSGRGIVWAPAEASFGHQQSDHHWQRDLLATALVGICIGRCQHCQQRQRDSLATALADIVTVCIGNGICILCMERHCHLLHGKILASYASAQASSSSTEAFSGIIILRQRHRLLATEFFSNCIERLQHCHQRQRDQ